MPVSGSIEVNTTRDWKWRRPSWGVSLAKEAEEGVEEEEEEEE